MNHWIMDFRLNHCLGLWTYNILLFFLPTHGFILPIIVWCGGARVRLPFAMENNHETKTSNKFTRMQLKIPGSLPKKVLFRQPAQNPKIKNKKIILNLPSLDEFQLQPVTQCDSLWNASPLHKHVPFWPVSSRRSAKFLCSFLNSA